MKIEENKQNALSEELKLSLSINKEKVYIGITRWSYSQLLIIKKDNGKSNKMIMRKHYFGGRALFGGIHHDLQHSPLDSPIIY